MVLFFKGMRDNILAVQVTNSLVSENIIKLEWLFDGASYTELSKIDGNFIGPRREMVTPWSTNAVEITQNMGISGIVRIEEFFETHGDDPVFDPMLQRQFRDLDQHLFTIDLMPAPVLAVINIGEYNKSEGLALSNDEVEYLEGLSKKLNRALTDSEVFGFSQVNSEHCRHKIFNGTFIIDGIEMKSTLFQLIKKTSKEFPGKIISAYKDNVAFISGPVIEQFAPETGDKPDFFVVKDIESVISLKAETHNFPTTVEPFNGAATGTGGEIRDRLAGGKGSLPIAGTAVYMTSYPRNAEGKGWEEQTSARDWLYQTPEEILIKASNGASDFGNKFGQPLICGSLLTFEHFENSKKFGFDKVIMMAGGIGFGKLEDSQKDLPEPGEKIVVLGGDNYRIGMGGGAVSSVATGEFNNAIELNAVQRSNPEMQKRVANAIRALVEADVNPIVSMHDHGAGGHLNCLSELVDATGGIIDIDQLPVGDPTLSSKEIIGNESQERMGLILKAKDVDLLKRIADRERAPLYVVGEATGDHVLTFAKQAETSAPIHLRLDDMFGNPPKTVLTDTSKNEVYADLKYDYKKIEYYIDQVLQLESVACKDWLTNKVDRSVTGKVAMQQCVGELQLPLNNLGVVALDYQGVKGIATSIGHAPASALVNAANGSVLAVAEALTNMVWAPIESGLKGVSLSANWMWPAKNEGENARLYAAVEALSDFACALGINVPTGKDSMSMTQKYPNGDVVYSPGTVIVSTVGEVTDIRKTVNPVLKYDPDSMLIYVDFSKDKLKLGGSSLGQVLNKLGTSTPTVKDAKYFSNAFTAIQELIESGRVLAGHDISSGGLITALFEMNFANTNGGLNVDLNTFIEKDIFKLLFSENPAVLIQINDVDCLDVLRKYHIDFYIIGQPIEARKLLIESGKIKLSLEIDTYRDIWFRSSFLLDQKQSGKDKARQRFDSYRNNILRFTFPTNFDGSFAQYGIDPNRRYATGTKAAIIREKGVNGDREMAYSLYLAGFDVKDVHMTDLISGRENLEDINLIVFVGGFSNSDVLGSAKGWAGAFLYNPKAKEALDNFYKRSDTLSLGVCNGCQLMVELGLIYPNLEARIKMLHNESHKFESGFINVNVQPNSSVMLGTLSGSRLGVWVAHGEGKFKFPYIEDKYKVALKYSYSAYPANPNGSDFNVAGICSEDGRHLAMMPHLERAIFPWQWPHYEENNPVGEVSPWIEAFVNAKKWIEKK